MLLTLDTLRKAKRKHSHEKQAQPTPSTERIRIGWQVEALDSTPKEIDARQDKNREKDAAAALFYGPYGTVLQTVQMTVPYGL